MVGIASFSVFLLNKPPMVVAGTGSGHGQPVLVELFTSEGCSSCPPADALLARLDAEQFVPGAQAIVLSEHVTYWNQLGWRDPFSMDQISERQREYAQRLGLESVYTPQVVVDGAAELVGSDSAALSRAISNAAEKAKPELKIEHVTWDGDMLHFAVRALVPQHGTLVAALAEDATQVSVARGENAGRTLHHVAVVRALNELGKDAADGRTLALNLAETANQAEYGKAMRLVVFLADGRTGRVLAVAERPIAR